MKFTVECRACVHAFEPPRETIVLGRWQQACPVCNPPRQLKEHLTPAELAAPGRDDDEAA